MDFTPALAAVFRLCSSVVRTPSSTTFYRADQRVTDGTQAYMAYEAEKYALYNSNGLDLEDRVKSAMCYAMPLVADSGEMYDGFEMKKLLFITLS